MPTEYLPLDKIVYNRDLVPGDNLSSLKVNIKDNGGLLVPILVDADFNLIDGLRRLHAHRLLRKPEIEAYMSWTHEESIEWLAKAHHEGTLAVPMTPRRVAQIHTALDPQLKARQALVHERQKGLPKKGRGRKPREAQYNSRVLLVKALKLSSEAVVQTAKRLYEMEREESPAGNFVRTLIPHLDAGELTAYQAWERFDRWNKDRSFTITNEAEQRQIISAAATQLRAIVNGLGPIGDINIRIKKEEAIKWLAELTLANRQVRKTMKQLRKRLD